VKHILENNFESLFAYYFTVPSSLRYEFYKASPHSVIVVSVQWTPFFKCFYWPWCSTQICWEDSVLLCVWVERRSMGKLM